MKNMLAILTVLFISIAIQSQTSLLINNNEFLAYIQIVEDNKIFVIYKDNTPVSYNMESDECGDISLDGRYLALSSIQADMLSIIHSPTQKIVLKVPWSSTWLNCSLSWREDNLLAISNVDDSGYFYFRLSGSSLIEVSNPDVISNPPSLPNYFPNIVETFILQSPSNPDIYLYERCPDGIVIYDFICEEKTDFVIYNSAENQDIAFPKDLSDGYVRGFYADTTAPYGRFSISLPLVSWSPNGRYLSYFSSIYNPYFEHDGKIIIYDLQMNRYLNDNSEPSELLRPNIWRNLQWSDENVLVIWKTGGFNDEYPYSFHSLMNYFAFVHADNELYATSVFVFDAWNANSHEGVVFAPDSRAIAILGYERLPLAQEAELGTPWRGNLILISTTTGEHTVIDTDVTEIITWRSICDFTATDTASLISTMQSEPYGVICLDENGQYDLTTPLPDVAGDITIIGNGATITMTGQNRVFNVVYNQQWSRNGSLTLKNVTLSGGIADEGGAIYNAGDLTLENVILENHSAVRGGAIYNTGNLVMNGGAIQNNSASEFGGGIYNLGDMQLDGVNIRENTAPEGSGVYQG
jgi:hypothetical protein